jgi:hypothetical protein
VDENGTFNFSEDLSRVPKKYRKNVSRRGDMGGQGTAPANAGTEKSKQADPRQVEDSNGKPSGLPGGDNQLYGGKTQDAWRKELNVHESELKMIEQQLDQIWKQINKPMGISRVRQSELTREYENTRVTYNQKYKIYSELIESARKAGLVIEIKK